MEENNAYGKIEFFQKMNFLKLNYFHLGSIYSIFLKSEIRKRRLHVAPSIMYFCKQDQIPHQQ